MLKVNDMIIYFDECSTNSRGLQPPQTKTYTISTQKPNKKRSLYFLYYNIYSYIYYLMMCRKQLRTSTTPNKQIPQPIDPTFSRALESLAALKLHKFAIKRKEHQRQRTDVSYYQFLRTYTYEIVRIMR